MSQKLNIMQLKLFLFFQDGNINSPPPIFTESNMNAEYSEYSKNAPKNIHWLGQVRQKFCNCSYLIWVKNKFKKMNKVVLAGFLSPGK